MDRRKSNEWLDCEKKQSKNFRQLLQERIKKSNPLRKLTAGESKRLARLHTIADKLKREAVELGELDTLIEQQAQFGRSLTLKSK